MTPQEKTTIVKTTITMFKAIDALVNIETIRAKEPSFTSELSLESLQEMQSHLESLTNYASERESCLQGLKSLLKD